MEELNQQTQVYVGSYAPVSLCAEWVYSVEFRQVSSEMYKY